MDTIRLDELAMQQLGVSRQEADGLIMAGRIFIGEIPADKAGTPVPADTVLTLRERRKNTPAAPAISLNGRWTILRWT